MENLSGLNEAWFIAKDRGPSWEEGGWLVLALSMLIHRMWLLLSIPDFLAPPPVALMSCHLSFVLGRSDLMSGGAGIPRLQPLGQVPWAVPLQDADEHQESQKREGGSLRCG